MWLTLTENFSGTLMLANKPSNGCSGEQPNLRHGNHVIRVEVVVGDVDNLLKKLLCGGLLGGILLLLKLLCFLLGHLLQRDKDE